MVLTRRPAGGCCGWETARPRVGAGGVSTQERRGDASFCCPSRAPPDDLLEAPLVKCRRRLAASLQGFCRCELPSPRSRHYRCRPRSYRPHQENPPRTPPSASTLRSVSRALAARGSSSSLFSFPSTLQTFAILRTRASSRNRRCPPLPEASRTEHRSIPIQASVSPKEDRKDRKPSDSDKKSSPGCSSPRQASWGSY